MSYGFKVAIRKSVVAERLVNFHRKDGVKIGVNLIHAGGSYQQQNTNFPVIHHIVKWGLCPAQGVGPADRTPSGGYGFM